MKNGDVFNPWRRFRGIFIPEGLAGSSKVSPTAKLLYGHLCRRAGENGRCCPSRADIAAGIGVSEEQARRAICELEMVGLIRRVHRHDSTGRQMSNGYEFLWSDALLPENTTLPVSVGVEDHIYVPPLRETQEERTVSGGNTAARARETAPPPPKTLPRPAPPPPKPIRRVLPMRQEVPPAPDPSPPLPYTAEERENVRCWLQEFQTERYGWVWPLPDDRIVGGVLNALRGQPVAELHGYLQQLAAQRRRDPPRSYAWFVTVVGDRFRSELPARRPPRVETRAEPARPRKPPEDTRSLEEVLEGLERCGSAEWFEKVRLTYQAMGYESHANSNHRSAAAAG